MSQRACPICREERTRDVVRWRMGYTICECEACGVLFSDPLPSPEQLVEFYQGFLYKKPSPARLSELVATRCRELASLLGRNDGSGLRLLDHGGGTGLTYAAAKALGFDAYYNDLDQQAVALLREQHGLDDVHYVAELGKATQRFEFIVSDNVIEHVPDPISVMRELVALLAPSGVLIIKTPWAKASEQFFYPMTAIEYVRRAAAYDGPKAALDMLRRSPIWCCDPPRHLYGFTPESLLEVARQAGVPASWCETDAYENPLLDKSLIGAYRKPSAGLLGVAKRGVAMPLLGVEATLKLAHFAARKARLVTPTGLVLRVRRAA